MKLPVLMLVSLLLVLSARGSAQGTNIYDSGFRPEINGFSFENYGNEVKTVGITPIEMQRMFGDQACVSTAGGKYILSPPAKAWMEEANKAMGDGHCEGMAVLSTLLYFNQSDPNKFGGNEADKLSLGNEALQREIAYWWVTQVTHPGGSHRVNDSPNVILDTLASEFKAGRAAKEWWTLGLYQPDGNGGHDITPIAVENSSNGTARILVYDNNFPKVTRAIEIDQKANTWKYHTSSNPSDPSETYTGNASTKSLEIVSIPPRLVRQDCDFCDNGNNSGLAGSKGTKGALSDRKNVIQFWVDGDARLLVTDESGLRVGYLGEGNFVNEIPNASAIHLKYMNHPGTIHHEPIIIVPQGNNTSAKLTGINNSSDPDLTVIGHNYVASAKNLVLNPDEQVDLTVVPSTTSPNVYSSVLTASNVESTKTATLSFGFTTPTQTIEVTIVGAVLDNGGRVTLQYDEVLKTFSFGTDNNANPGLFNVLIVRTDSATGEQQTFANDVVPLAAGSMVTLDLSSQNLNNVVAEVQSGGETTTMTLQDIPSLHPETPAPPSPEPIPGETPGETGGNAQPTATVSFTVENETGTVMIPNALISVTDGAGISKQATTDNNGQATITGVPGFWQYTISATGYVTNTTTKRIDLATNVIVHLQQLATVSFTVENETGTVMIPNALISVTDGAGISKQATTDSNGQATITGVPGSWQYTISAAGYDTITGTMPIDPASNRVIVYLQETPKFDLVVYVTTHGYPPV